MRGPDKKENEIERKWVVQAIPELDCYDSEIILQSYISITDHSELRIRKRRGGRYNRHELTFKGAGNLSRPEVNLVIDDEMGYELMNIKDNIPIIKARMYHEYNSHELEIEFYKGAAAKHLFGLCGTCVVVEIEFDSEEDANNFKPPEWFDEDVTEDPRFKNKNIFRAINEEEANHG